MKKTKFVSKTNPSALNDCSLPLVDLFCGAGGLSLGFQNAGFSPVLAIDNWDAALNCYKANFDHAVKRMDLADWKAVVEGVRPYRPSIIIGGPPCQDFSNAGLRVEGKRAKLTVCYAKVVEGVLPQCFVMENVPRAQRSSSYAAARKIFKKSGYGLTEMVLDASLCGVPQLRRRFFCIGVRGEVDGFLNNALLYHQSIFPLSIRDCFGEEFAVEHYYRHPRSYARRAIFSIDEPSPTIRGCNRPLPPKYKKHAADSASPTRHGLRALTMSERAQLQLFPSSYKWIGSLNDCNQIIGNAVPVGLAQYVADRLFDYLERGGNATVPKSFPVWLHDVKGLSIAAAGDVVSHYRRACRLIKRPSHVIDIRDEVMGANGFKSLKREAKNQIVHAFDLYAEYKNNIEREAKNEKAES